MPHIFISYSKKDIEFMRYLRAALEAEGFVIWVDEDQLTPSTRWWKIIEQNIEQCAAFVVIMSPNAYESDWVEREILLAENKQRPIIPVLLAGEPWSRLANIQHVDMRAGLRAMLSAHFLDMLRVQLPAQTPVPSITFKIVNGDIMTHAADVVAFKYAGNFYGVDLVVSQKLVEKGIKDTKLRPGGTPGDFQCVTTRKAIAAKRALFVATPKMRNLGYKHLREFAARILEVLTTAAPKTKHLAMTTHGPGFSLDEQEAMLSLLAGFRDAMQAGTLPTTLETITIVEINKRRVNRLRAATETVLKKDDTAVELEDGWGYRLALPETSEAAQQDRLGQAGAKAVKPHAFVVLPSQSFDEDIFEYGIQMPVHAHGLLCERYEDLKEDHFSEQALTTLKEGIETASVVIVELTEADPSVYLQLGYAWGKSLPVILLLKHGQTYFFEVTEDVVRYQKIKDVEAAISEALDKLKAESKL